MIDSFADYENMLKAELTSHDSKDKHRQVGCVLVNERNHTIVRACNAMPKYCDDTVAERHERPEKYFWYECAERNAIYKSLRLGFCIDRATAYVNFFPCVSCARALIQCRIARLVAYKPDFDHPRWGEQFRKATEILADVGMPITLLDEVGVI